VAQDHRAAALLARHRGLHLDLGRLRFAFLVEVDDRRAARLALLVLHRIPRAAQELAKAPAALDHFAAADRAFVFADLADARLALRVHRLRRVALAVLAGEEEPGLADPVEHLLAALLAFIDAGRAARVLDLPQRPIHDLV